MVVTSPLHCLGHKIKYGSPEAGNTAQQFLSTTRPYCSIEIIESFLFWVILATYNIDIHIYIASYTHSFLLSLTLMFFLHCMLSILRYENISCEIDESITS